MDSWRASSFLAAGWRKLATSKAGESENRKQRDISGLTKARLFEVLEFLVSHLRWVVVMAVFSFYFEGSGMNPNEELAEEED